MPRIFCNLRTKQWWMRLKIKERYCVPQYVIYVCPTPYHETTTTINTWMAFPVYTATGGIDFGFKSRTLRILGIAFARAKIMQGSHKTNALYSLQICHATHGSHWFVTVAGRGHRDGSRSCLPVAPWRAAIH